MSRLLFVTALAIAACGGSVVEARKSLWANNRDKVNRNSAGTSDYIGSLQKLKHLAVEHHSLMPPHIRTASGAFNLDSGAGNKVFHDGSTPDTGVTSLLTEDLPYWTFLGSAVATDDYVRLTPNRQSQQGAVWNLEPLDLPSFELRVGIRIHSKGSVGADGMAVWIVDEIPSSFGPTFGLPTKFHGLGILVDTYDNDGNRDNPAISLLYNSEEDKRRGRVLSVETDYKNDVLGRCTVDFRNQIDPTVLILRYRAPDGKGHDEGKIELSVVKSSKATDKEESEIPCVSVVATQARLALTDPNRKYWLGATAETGGMSDNHDLVFAAILPLAGVEYERDVHGIVSDEVKQVLAEEANGERMHRYVNRQDKEERTYWKAKSKEEEDKERQEKAKAYLEQLHREAEQQKAERMRKFAEEEAAQHQQQQQQQQIPQQQQQQYVPQQQQQIPQQQQYVPQQQQQIPQQQEYVPQQQQQQVPQQQQYVPQQQQQQQQQIPQQQYVPQQQQQYVPQQQQQIPQQQQQQQYVPQQQQIPQQQQQQYVPQQQQQVPQQQQQQQQYVPQQQQQQQQVPQQQQH